MKIKSKKWIPLVLDPENTGEINCYGFSIGNESKIGFFVKDSVTTHDSNEYYITDKNIPNDWIITNDNRPYGQYTTNLDSYIVGPKEIFEENPFKAYIEIFEGGEMSEKFKDYVRKIEGPDAFN